MAKSKTAKQQDTPDDKLTKLMDHYLKGVEDMDIRRTRKNGWNDIINAYMGKLPANWPYNALVTDPRIRTTILEKTARLLNAKLQGRLIPREGTDVTKARINNAVLDYQWDAAEHGGSMIEKVALSDQSSRLFGAGFALVYWDTKNDTNELKPIDPRDIFIDFAANHIKNAKWVQVREFTTIEALKTRGFDVSDLDPTKTMDEGAFASSDHRSSAYEDQVKINRQMTDRTGEDLSFPTLELVTEYSKERAVSFLPRYGRVVKDIPNPYKHGLIPIAQLRYYPLGDDVYGESEVESVIPLQRAINAVLCGFIDEMNLAMRPPVRIPSSGVRIETIEFGPGAKWIGNASEIGLVQEVAMGGNAVQSFNATYPALVAAFETAMGGQSLGVSNIGASYQGKKTATEIASTERQQNNRDQYNQLYLAEFLKDIMMMWLSNNKQYLFDDPTKQYYILKIIGKSNIQQFQQMNLDDQDLPPEAIDSMQGAIEANPGAVTDDVMQSAMNGMTMPTNPVVTNPNDDPATYDIKNKLNVHKNGQEADLYVTPEDLEGLYDYIPDVRSMAAGAGIMQQQARQKAYDMLLTNPQVLPLLQQEGEMLKVKELLVNILEDAGDKDPEGLFQPIKQQPTLPGGPQALGAGPVPLGANGPQGIQGLPPSVPGGPGPVGIPGPQGLPNPGQAANGLLPQGGGNFGG